MDKQATTSRPLILASTSQYRRQLMDRLRLPFETADPEVDEEPYKRRGLSPTQLVEQLAEAKARAVAVKHPAALIVGGDQVVTIDEHVLGKPGTVERTVEQLMQLAGRTHQLVTALCLLDTTTDRANTVVDVHEMTMRQLTDEQVRRYVEVDQPLDCAGAYKLESLGVALFERVSGCDPTAIIGIPMMSLTSMLLEFGFDVFAHAK